FDRRHRAIEFCAIRLEIFGKISAAEFGNADLLASGVAGGKAIEDFDVSRRERAQAADDACHVVPGPAPALPRGDPALAKTDHRGHDFPERPGNLVVAFAITEFALIRALVNSQTGMEYRLHQRDRAARPDAAR